jgi:hypothetical protein
LKKIHFLFHMSMEKMIIWKRACSLANMVKAYKFLSLLKKLFKKIWLSTCILQKVAQELGLITFSLWKVGRPHCLGLTYLRKLPRD